MSAELNAKVVGLLETMVEILERVADLEKVAHSPDELLLRVGKIEERVSELARRTDNMSRRIYGPRPTPPPAGPSQ